MNHAHDHHAHDHHEHHEEDLEHSYKPLIVIVALITLVTVAVGLQAVAAGQFTLEKVMSIFMGGYFLVFSGFKLMDLKGFADGYADYDLLAQKVYGYGYIYPFIELGLGLIYGLGLATPAVNLFTLALMLFSGVGVLIKLAKKEPFQCACLGTLLKVPLTKVTLVEDFGMAAMALVMLVLG